VMTFEVVFVFLILKRSRLFTKVTYAFRTPPVRTAFRVATLPAMVC
jgi:hypothetical protein